jgi:hypothetical protein
MLNFIADAIWTQDYTSSLTKNFNYMFNFFSIWGIPDTNEQTIIKNTCQTLIDGSGILTLANMYKDMLKHEIRGLPMKYYSTTKCSFSK